MESFRGWLAGWLSGLLDGFCQDLDRLIIFTEYWSTGAENLVW